MPRTRLASRFAAQGTSECNASSVQTVFEAPLACLCRRESRGQAHEEIDFGAISADLRFDMKHSSLHRICDSKNAAALQNRSDPRESRAICKLETCRLVRGTPLTQNLLPGALPFNSQANVLELAPITPNCDSNCDRDNGTNDTDHTDNGDG
jgi:hypothetical protein